MSDSQRPDLGVNSWLEDELYQEYLHDRKTVDESWKEVFESNGGASGDRTHSSHPVSVMNGESTQAVAVAPREHQAVAGETLVPLRGTGARIAENMNASLSVPLATSQRV